MDGVCELIRIFAQVLDPLRQEMQHENQFQTFLVVIPKMLTRQRIYHRAHLQQQRER